MALRRAHANSLDRLIVETRMLFRALRGAAERIHLDGSQTAARRSILVELFQEGPQTVPSMADARHHSRQGIQGLVNALAADGLVERQPNPDHKRSWLWRVTPEGGARVSAMQRREQELLGNLNLTPDQARIDAACEVLAEVRQAMDAL